MNTEYGLDDEEFECRYRLECVVSGASVTN